MTDSPAPPANQPQAIDVPLEHPIVRGEEKITTVTLRKPKAGALRGLTMTDLMQGDVNTVLAVLPRISTPALTDPEVDNLEAEDLAEFTGALRTFFMGAQERDAMDRILRGSSSD